MKLREWTKEVAGRPIELATAIGASPVLISQWSTGKRLVPIERCVPIERATMGEVSRRDLRPDDWHEIWPELADLEEKQPLPSAARPSSATNSIASTGA
jgi:DNA-binding transcriptional regulator YdaS (Cro superfamily)